WGAHFEVFPELRLPLTKTAGEASSEAESRHCAAVVRLLAEVPDWIPPEANALTCALEEVQCAHQTALDQNDGSAATVIAPRLLDACALFEVPFEALLGSMDPSNQAHNIRIVYHSGGASDCRELAASLRVASRGWAARLLMRALVIEAGKDGDGDLAAEVERAVALVESAGFEPVLAEVCCRAAELAAQTDQQGLRVGLLRRAAALSGLCSLQSDSVALQAALVEAE
ncbi:MAG: hypothetical protein KC561_16785, partial [Myxococcales bacterium]|nr:hypothetical protein [Myxococcales bacterium]